MMELWEGAVLIVGGVFLVSYMAKKAGATPSNRPTVIGSNATALGSLGTTNMSNLTNITNTAAGQPTVYVEPLEPVMTPIIGPVSAPGMVPSRMPMTPIYRSPAISPRLSGGAVPVVARANMLSTARGQFLM